jgi:hypothetical protein
MSGDDSQCSVHLLRENERCHLVWQRHRSKREEQVGAFAAGLRKSVGGTHAKDELLMAGLLQFAKPLRKLSRTELFAPLIKKNQKGRSALSLQGRSESFFGKEDLLFHRGILTDPLHVGRDQRTPFGAFASPPNSVKN